MSHESPLKNKLFYTKIVIKAREETNISATYIQNHIFFTISNRHKKEIRQNYIRLL